MPSTALTGTAPPRILVADDDRVLTLLLSRRLSALGWRVEVAMDTMQVLMFAKRAAPDVITLDIGMPGGSGTEALRRLKMSAHTAQIPVLVLSGSLEPDIEQTVLGLGADAFMRKPVDPDALDVALRRLAST